MIAVSDLRIGQPLLEEMSGLIQQNIPAGHKLCVRRVAAGEKVLKYGQPIGVATQEILPGEHVHSHNLADDHQVQLDRLEVFPTTRARWPAAQL